MIIKNILLVSVWVLGIGIIMSFNSIVSFSSSSMLMKKSSALL